MNYPKVVIIGAGSLFFGRKSIWQMVHSVHLNCGTLALVDINETVLNKMVTLAKMVAESEGVKLKIEGSTNRRDVLKGADFVILTFAEKSAYYRGIDCGISEKYGVRMCSGDTIGPGGIFRAMRELPVILQCAKDIEELCPDAWVINYINPTTVHGIALKRFAPNLKSFALCDSQYMPHNKINYAIKAGIISEISEYTDETDKDFELRIAGVNHFTWMIKAEYKGKNVMPDIAETIRLAASQNEEGANNETYVGELYKIFGCIPTVGGHTKEYVRFWQGKNVSTDSIPALSIWKTAPRYERHKAMFEQVDSFISGETPISEYMTTFAPDHATDIIENMIAGLGKQYYINTFNGGAVSNMNDDAYLELLCDIDINGPKPVKVGEMPRGIRGMEEIVLDAHELTAAAVATGSYDLLRRAMMTDPLICSVSDADNIIKELLESEKEMIPANWYK